MSLLKPIITFTIGYYLLNYYKQYKEKIRDIRLVGEELYKLTENNKEFMLLLITSIISYFI